MNSSFYSNLLIIDIETVSALADYSELPDRFRQHWDKKSTQIKNEAELSTEDLYFRRAAIYAEFGKVVCISVGFFAPLESGEYQLRVTSFASDDEQRLLTDFKSLLSKFDQRQLRLVAHNGKEFDFPYICRRMLVNEIALPECLQINDKKPWEIRHIDTMELWKFGDKKNYTSLDLLATLFDIQSSKQEIDGSMVNETFYRKGNLPLIAEYCMQDVVVTAQLFLRLHLAPLIKEENITFVSAE